MSFNVSAVNDRVYGSQPTPILRALFQIKKNLPWQIGWFNFVELTENSMVDPGLGISVKALGM
jgi:hypothetical protein